VPQLREHQRLQLSARRRSAAALVSACLFVASCTFGVTDPSTSGTAASTRPLATSHPDPLLERLVAIDQAVGQWRTATDVTAAHAAAEATRNLVVGPAGPGYGDADGSGSIGGSSSIGLLPGENGQPGLADPVDGSCVVADVLGGSWSDAAGRWATLQAAIDGWAPSNNTFPALPSHPQRVVGWATLALASNDLATATEYGDHAALHASISRQAVTDCGS
jgi:hypothetical protein